MTRDRLWTVNWRKFRNEKLAEANPLGNATGQGKILLNIIPLPLKERHRIGNNFL
jgi:hypothetical protein